jgi:D-glycero-D-manno-heptose 1,7-bisphosphate phosphatase
MKLVILDRDGVINHCADNYISSVDEWQPIDGSLPAIGRLCQAGYTITLAINQPAIAHGYYDVETLHAVHKKMARLLEAYGGYIEGLFYCSHARKENCRCRKPKPGLLEDIAARYQCSLTGVPFIGDTINDIKAAHAAGAQPILVRTGKGEAALAAAGQQELKNVPVYKDLAQAVQAILMEN